MIDHSEVGPRVKLAFERESVVANVDDLVPLRMLRPGTKDTKKYLQIVRSIRAIGLVELPVITPDPNTSGRYFLLDGQLRIEALKDLGITEVECIISTDDETYTYNKKVASLVRITTMIRTPGSLGTRRPNLLLAPILLGRNQAADAPRSRGNRRRW